VTCPSRLAIQHEVTLALVRRESQDPTSCQVNRLTGVGQRKVIIMQTSDPRSSPVEVSSFAYVVGMDIGSQSAVYCVCQPDKNQVVKPTELANSRAGFEALDHRLRQLAVPPQRILIGLEATGRYSENLYQFLQEQGYRLCLLHPRQTHQFAQQRGLRAKTDRLDATTIARLLLSGEARPGYVPDELISTYRELERLHSQLTNDSARYQNEIQARLLVLFPEFVQVFADPCRPTALGVLKRYPGAQAILTAGVEALTSTLRELAPRHYGRPTAQELVRLASQSVATPLATSGRALSLKVLCDQLEHTLANLAQVAHELDQLLDRDHGASGLKSTPEFGRKTVAVLRAELGDVTRFQRVDQVVAYVGLDLQVRQSGKWKGQVKLSKRGSGRVRQVLYMAALRSLALPASAFGAYYRRLVARGLKARDALTAVMRKMLIVAYHLLRSNETYDPTKVCAVGCTLPRTPSSDT
jgi:transposase